MRITVIATGFDDHQPESETAPVVESKEEPQTPAEEVTEETETEEVQAAQPEETNDEEFDIPTFLRRQR